MLARLVLIAVAASGCAATQGVNTIVPLARPDAFASTVKRFRVRVTDPWVIIERGPTQPRQAVKTEVTTHHENVPELVRSLLAAKGYEVTFVWDDPWTYGRLRPCLMVKYIMEPETLKILSATPDPEAGPCKRPEGDHVGGYQMSRYDGPPLAADEAFLEIATDSIVDTRTTSTTVQTETQVGRVTDAQGNTVANVYETGQETRETQETERKASASIQVFVAGVPEPVLDALAWSRETEQVLGLVKEAIDRIPQRAR